MSESIYTVDDIRFLERIAIDELAITAAELMQRAGAAAWAMIQARLPKAASITVICGGGNNGGDGYVVAHLAHRQGWRTRVQATIPIDQLPREAANAAKACEASGVEIRSFSGELIEADVIVDALLGIGLQGDLREDALPLIQAINKSASIIISLDVPSGVHADTGYVPSLAVKAAETITFIGIKRGLLTGAAVDYVGELLCDDLAIPEAAFTQVHSTVKQVGASDQIHLKPRAKSAHKGQFGHVLAIGGNLGFSGAARMASEGALCVGAGRVSVATHRAHAAFLNVGRPELMVHAIESSNDLMPLIEKASVLIVGPGLGVDAWALDCFAAALACDKPTVLDADGLNLLAEQQVKKSHWILTPHPAEAARLLQSDADTVAYHRFDAARKIQETYGGVCVLKGAGTIIDDGIKHSVCTLGNPYMATAGMGDVLSGIIAGLLAQGCDVSDAAVGGVCRHAQAGDLAHNAGTHTILATDLFEYLKK